MTPASPPPARPLLRVVDLRTEFQSAGRRHAAVDGVSLEVSAGEALGLVGESGCGKSATLLSILRLVPDPPGRVAGGRVEWEGEDLLSAPEERLRRLRGDRIGTVFQDPASAFNPVMSVGAQVAEVLREHRGAGRAQARARAVELLGRAGLPAPERCVDAYPHELSGGMRQRAALAMALACEPSLLLADEPTTALDVTLQAQLLERVGRERRERGMALLLVTHDLGVVAEACDTAAVMYLGRIVERAPVAALFARPAHPYTAGLLRSLPARAPAGRRLPALPGSVPGPDARPSGCRFRDRCERAQGDCAAQEPVLTPRDAGGHVVACRHPL